MTRIFVAICVCSGLAAADTGLTITSPANLSPAAPGSTLAVSVSATGTFSQVVVAGEGAIGFSRVLTAPPYNFSIPLAARLSPGVYALTAMGVTPSGIVNSLPLTVKVERPDAPVEIDILPGTLTVPTGQRAQIRVLGTYGDGAKLDLTHSASITYSSDTPSIATVDSQGAVTAVSPGSAHIIVNNPVNTMFTVPIVVPQTAVVAPQWPVLYGGQRTQFGAFRPGMAAAPATWSISPQVGSINASGLYTAPRTINAQQAVMITATVQGTPVTTGVALYPPVAISVDPVIAVLSAGQTQRFAQTVSNALDQNVDWSISPKGMGTIDATGLYTAPATIKAQSTVVVTATSINDSSKTASAKITLQP